MTIRSLGSPIWVLDSDKKQKPGAIGSEFELVSGQQPQLSKRFRLKTQVGKNEISVKNPAKNKGKPEAKLRAKTGPEKGSLAGQRKIIEKVFEGYFRAGNRAVTSCF